MSKKSKNTDTSKKYIEPTNINYLVITPDLKHSTPSLDEALNLAKSTNGKVWWCIDGAVAGVVD